MHPIYWLILGTCAGFLAGISFRIVLDCFALSYRLPPEEMPREFPLRSRRCKTRRSAGQVF